VPQLTLDLGLQVGHEGEPPVSTSGGGYGRAARRSPASHNHPSADDYVRPVARRAAAHQAAEARDAAPRLGRGLVGPGRVAVLRERLVAV
jgi:hypothetical protein